jgi:hypothetical protein
MVGPTVVRWTNRMLSYGILLIRWPIWVLPFGTHLTVVHQSHLARWLWCWRVPWCGPIRFGHMALGCVTWLDGGLPHGTFVRTTCQVWISMGPTLMRWTNRHMPRVMTMLIWPNRVLPCGMPCLRWLLGYLLLQVSNLHQSVLCPLFVPQRSPWLNLGLWSIFFFSELF